jgi:hypothetical protein
MAKAKITSAPVVNLFTKAVAKPTASKKNEKLTIVMDKDRLGTKAAAKNFSDKLAEFNALSETLDNMQTEYEQLRADILNDGKYVYHKEFSRTKSNPGSFIMQAETNEKVMLVPMGKYKTLQEEHYNYLVDKYGTTIANQTDEYTLDSEVIEKYGAQISDAIVNSDLPAIIKDAFFNGISKKTKWAVAKDAMDNAFKLAPSAIGEFIEDVQAIFGIKKI